MTTKKKTPSWSVLGVKYKAHPWHGISAGDNVPNEVECFIEVVPSDTVKYEIDKESGYLRVDRPQQYSNIVPALYGFIPQTYCADEVAKFSAEKSGKENLIGDGDPLDICVLTDRYVPHGNILATAIPIGGFRMIDGGEADDKIIAVLKGDNVYGSWRDVADLPDFVVKRLQHYFLTYKQEPGSQEVKCEITHTYGREEAHKVIALSQEDYESHYGHLDQMVGEALGTN